MLPSASSPADVMGPPCIQHVSTALVLHDNRQDRLARGRDTSCPPAQDRKLRAHGETGQNFAQLPQEVPPIVECRFWRAVHHDVHVLGHLAEPTQPSPMTSLDRPHSRMGPC